MEKRVIFPKGKQNKFLTKSKGELKLNWPEFAQKLGINKNTLRSSYRYEYCSLPYKIFLKICQLRTIKIKNILKKYKAKIVYFDPLSIIGRKVLGEKRTKLPKLNIIFKSAPSKLDTSKIKLNRYGQAKKLKFPEELTPDLAEEIGMHVGDGFLSNKKYEYRLKGNKNEKKYYDLFIKPLYKKLFGMDINLREYETTYGFELYSKAFWKFKNQVLGIPAGRKEDIRLPNLIKVNNIKILTSFLRGLFDTDGSVSFLKKYNNFGNYYPVISLCLKSKNLIFETAEILQMLGLEPKTSKSGPYWGISLNGYKRLERYSKIIGWSNPKKIGKVIKWKKQYPDLGKEVMVGVV